MNLSGLSGMWNQIADYKRSDDLPYMKGKRPRLRTGGFQAVVVDESAAQKDYRERVIMERIEAIKNRQGPPQKGDDILLTVITDAKHVAMDERFADSTLSGSGGKLGRMAAKILEIHAEGSRGADPDLRTQIVFMDLGLPDMLDKRGFSAYLALRETLVEGGIPAREIAFAQDYKTKDAKSALQEAVRAGRVRVLIGSMAGMGTGWNVQERLAAAHFLTIPWYPALVEQAVGRIVRQGNSFASVSVPADAESWAQDAFYPGLLEEAYDRLVGEVDVFCYMTKGTIEEFMWGMNENKSRWIEGFYRGGVDEFDGELDSESDQYAVLRQMTSDDPRVLRLAEMQGEMARLQGLERAHLDDMAAIASAVEKNEAFRKSDEDALAKWENIPEPPSTRKDAFLAEIGGKTFEKRPEALKALLAQTARAVESGQDTLAVAFGGGFEVWAERDTLVPGHAVMTFKHRGTPLRISPINVAMADDSQRAGLLQKIENAINGIPERLSRLRRQIQESKELTERLKARITPFERGPEIEEMRRRIRALQDEMTASSQAVPGRGAPAAGGGVAEARRSTGRTPRTAPMSPPIPGPRTSARSC